MAPILAVGYDPVDTVLWEDWTLWRFSSKEYTGSWFPINSIKDIPSYFSEFYRRSNDASWKEWIHTVLYWYVQSNGITGVDIGIVTSQIVLELAADFAASRLSNQNRHLRGRVPPDGIDRLVPYRDRALPIQYRRNFKV